VNYLVILQEEIKLFIAFATNAARSGLNEPHFNPEYSDSATCIHNLHVYTALRKFMAKLYWRIKKNGKWTWRAAEELYYLDKDCSNIIVKCVRSKGKK